MNHCTVLYYSHLTHKQPFLTWPICLSVLITAAGLPEHLVMAGKFTSCGDPLFAKGHSDKGGNVTETQEESALLITHNRYTLNPGVRSVDG